MNINKLTIFYVMFKIIKYQNYFFSFFNNFFGCGKYEVRGKDRNRYLY